MKKLLFALAVVCSLAVSAEEQIWKAHWISKQQCNSVTNTWLAFHKKVDIQQVPASLNACIAADTKYWMWINGELVVFEGGLKRGPSRGDSYYDEVEIAPYLKQGANDIAILLWHFGKNGFSHVNSGTAALLFQAVSPEVEILSGRDWEASECLAYQMTEAPHPNHRIAESNIRFDARMEKTGWNKASFDGKWGNAMQLASLPGESPFGKLVKRPIPQWKDYGMKEYVSTRQVGDTIYCRLPYNCQVTPYLKVQAPAGRTIKMQTDHYVVPYNENSVRAEYVTREGEQEYESLGWMNGDEMIYVIPNDVKVLSLKYRETGYNTEFTGDFRCDDEFFNDYWKKSVRTLYVCMRDTYMDCPDRERAQWWGDEINELGEAFYALSPSSAQLARKGIMELVNWQREDGTMFAPIPTGNYFMELPMQILASVGWYGFYTYYYYSGDKSFVASVYDRIQRYLHVAWKVDADGLPIYRKGEWDWPDAGDNCDGVALVVPWYYLALKAEKAFADMLGRTADIAHIEKLMAQIESNFNKRFWNGKAYRSAEYAGATDDRVQAMAVVSGLASPDKYKAIVQVLAKEFHATTYMQRYVMEALIQMGQTSMALDRLKKLIPTVSDDVSSTLYEHWNFDGSRNHAWTGGPIILLGQKVAGIEPTAPAFQSFKVMPHMGYLKEISSTVDTPYGKISVKLTRNGSRAKMELTVPEGTTATVRLASGARKTLQAGLHTETILAEK